MDWIKCLSGTLDFIENHLTDDISIEDISRQSFTSASHFQLIFHVVMGMTIGDYIRSRRLSTAAQDLLQNGSKIIDIAAKYRYDTQESFSKAFTRFHGIPPSKARQGNVKMFHPLSISISITGGFDMSRKLIDDFLLFDFNSIESQNNKQNGDAYKSLVSWAGMARGRNPGVFDALTEWILDDTKWGNEHIKENEWILMHGVLARFKDQNAKLRAFLKELEPHGVVNKAVFAALDRFDDELSGKPHDKRLRETVGRMFADFSCMSDSGVRRIIAGYPKDSMHMNDMGYVNYLKDCDAGVQWTLFMPDKVQRQQQGFRVESFEYLSFPAMRFIGIDNPSKNDKERCLAASKTLDEMTEHKSDFNHDIIFMHHNGMGVDVEDSWRAHFGRFMKANAPVPDGFMSLDFEPKPPGKAGAPYISQFAFAVFSGDTDAMHKREGFDVDAMYDVTRNIILGQGVSIPYPNKYWTAEVFLNGCGKPGTGYLFSANK